jgi:protein-S-isoprenylcysteine O-methyltransferase Ste14
VIFRDSNLQKQRFRRDPSRPVWGKPPKVLKTKRGTQLLLSGWWGLSRHANYLGDLMMALSWCLTCGFTHVIPYFYFIYFAPLLINRERRDHALCKEKYGADWDEYCKRVPSRIIPGIY